MVLAYEGHIVTLSIHLLNVFLEDVYGVRVEICFLHFEEGCFEEIHVGVDLFLLSLVEALALFGCFVGSGVVDVAEELRHLDEIPAGLPVLPADLASREESSVIKGE